MVDIAIVGSGIAAVSAALTAKLRGKSVSIFGSRELGRKYEGEHVIANYPGFTKVPASELKNAIISQLEAENLVITEDKISAVYAMGASFTLMGAKDSYEARTVIIATGVSAVKPYEGESEYLGRGVSYCATCDAMLYKGRPVAVIADSAKEEDEVKFLASVASEVTYIPGYECEATLGSNVTVLKGNVKKIEGRLKAEKAVLSSGEEVVADAFFILREQVAPNNLVPGLKTEGSYIAVDRQMRTNIAGCFACGDVTGAPLQYAKAAGEGNIAALSAVNYINTTKTEV